MRSTKGVGRGISLPRERGYPAGRFITFAMGFAGVGKESLWAIANELQLPVDTVYQAAGFLPLEQDDPW